MTLMDNINYYYYELSDPRIKDWFFMDSIWYPIATILIYIVVAFKLTPAFMKNRPAYKLKTYIKCYNIFQVIVNGYIFKNLVSCYSFLRALESRPIVYTTNACDLMILKCAYIGVWLKLIDLSETVVYILRKKYNQVSFLHLYHHISTFLLTLICVKYVSSEVTLLAGILNTFVHVIMYTYYFLSTFQGSTKQVTIRFKRYLTLVQMVQFVIVIGQLILFLALADQMLLRQYSIVLLFNYCFNFWLFSHFYKSNYVDSKKKRG